MKTYPLYKNVVSYINLLLKQIEQSHNIDIKKQIKVQQ